MMMLLFIVGCGGGGGGGEDFSKPPDAVADRMAKAPEPAKQEPAKSETAAKPDVTKEVAASSDKKPADPTPEEKTAAAANEPTPLTSPAKPEAAGAKSTVDAEGGKPVPAASPATPPGGSTEATAAQTKKPDEEETMTASGRSAKALAKKKEDNSKMTVTGNAGGLLGSLKGNKGTAGPNNPAPTAANAAPEVLSRFGRMALSQPDWLRLVTQLSRRFYVGTSVDGTRILASSGERSGGIVQIETMPELQGRYGTREAQDELLQSVTSLPGQVSCVELTGDGSTALFGTKDGRVLVRMISGKHNWDLYARDLFLFQDEIRPSARLSEVAIVLLRAIQGEKLLSIDAQGQCSIWKTADVIQPVQPIETISTSNLASLASTTVTPSPLAKFEVKGLQILSFCESADGQWLAVISSDETVTIVETASGTVFDQLTAEHFADTQPVCVSFLPERREILAGLADGRIFRRAFGKEGEPVSGLNDAGEPVDYDAVFIPDVKDRPDSITAITPIPGTSFAYVGSVTGTLSRLDVSQRRMELLPSKQEGAIIELKQCPFGTLAIGEERHATLFDQPISPITLQSPAARTLALPTDEALKETDSTDPETAGAQRPPTRTASLLEPPMDQEMVGIRPPKPETALLHHQLRSATDPEYRQTVRRSILQSQGKDETILDPPAEGLPPAEKTVPEPVLISEYTADYQFSGQAWQDVRMSCSLDGRMAVLSHPSRPGISIVDMPTGVTLRHWTAVPNFRQLVLNEQLGRLIPSGPAPAELVVSTGALMIDPLRRYLVCAISPDEKTTILGHFGTAGLAAKALTRIDDSSSSRSDALEMFECMVTALAYSSNGESLYASFRSRNQSILQELDPKYLTVRTTLITESLPGTVPDDLTVALDGTCGVTLIQSTATNKSLLTFGTHEDGPQMRLWRRTSKGWPMERVQIFRNKDLLPDSAVSQPIVFVNQQDLKVAIITTAGLAILNVKKEKLENHLPIPNVGSRRPSTCFSPDARWLLSGDAEGNIWVLSLNSPAKKPLMFPAHAGPIAGLAISANGKFLLTAGEDKRIRSWSIGEYLLQ